MVDNDINSFKLRQIQQTTPLMSKKSEKNIYTENKANTSFEQLLNKELKISNSLQFSKHSRERIQQRGIKITDTLLKQLNDAVNNAKLKGAKDVVVISNDTAFIISISNNTVVTAMNGNEMKNNIFTKIDSAVLI